MAVDVSTDKDDMLTAIGSLIATITGLDIYEERTNFTEPEDEYATIYINTYERTNQDFMYRGYDDDGYENRTMSYEVTCTVKAYKGTPQAALLSLLMGLETPAYTNTLREDSNIGLLRTGTISDVSSVIDGSSWEARAAVPLTFHVLITHIDEEEAEYIETIEVDEGIIYDVDDTIIKTIDFSVIYDDEDEDEDDEDE